MDAQTPSGTGHDLLDDASARPPGASDAAAGADPRRQVTEILLDLRSGDDAALDALFQRIYDDLHRIARRQLRKEADGHTLCATALVHEAYLKLVDQTRVKWANRAHFFAIAARVMRRILVDHARRHRAAKRGGDWERLDLDDVEIPVDERAGVLIGLDDALERLARLNPRLSQVVECRFFGGMTEEEIAAALGVTERTVRRDWVKAKGWLHQALPADPD